MSRDVCLEELVDDDAALEATVRTDGLAWDFAGLPDDLDADVLVEVGALHLVKCVRCIK